MAVTVDSAQWLLNEFISGLRHTEEVLSFVGIFCIGKITVTTMWDVATGLRVHFWSKLVTRHWAKEYGKWAVVTGSTDGIGKGYATVLAKNGMNIVLISRFQKKLERVAQEIRNRYGVQTETVKADFPIGQPVYDDISKHLQDKEIGILVNSVGVISNPVFFENMPEEDLWAQININVASVPAMTRLVLPGMLARKKGAIINISSSGALVPYPLLQVFSATKAFVNYYSQALEFEYRSSGITVQTIVSAGLSTDIRFFNPSPTTFAAHALSTLGYARCTTGYWIHGILVWFMERIPWWFAMRCFMLTHKSNLKKKV
ncbi:inactive hydroxysteroid dehydrogenase-like protein 1 [Panulirus ornatus]|uniref:inactive hydroxysteroid dehydrogenase-like protein 1 n=1 Tax=Panulirus ornatus TaxID=150431 RepID=UPI003A860293